jgi:anti-sigma B factor antagonist
MSSTPTPAGLVIQRQNDVQVIEFMDTNVLDQVRIEQIRTELDGIVAKAGHPKIIISFENVAHISSAVLGVLMSLDKKVKAKGGELRLANISASIRQVFSLTRLDKALKIFNSTDEALARF